MLLWPCQWERDGEPQWIWGYDIFSDRPIWRITSKVRGNLWHRTRIVNLFISPDFDFLWWPNNSNPALDLSISLVFWNVELSRFSTCCFHIASRCMVFPKQVLMFEDFISTNFRTTEHSWHQQLIEWEIHHTMWGPLVISWFITQLAIVIATINPGEIGVTRPNLAIERGPHIVET